jgi:PAS domain S-box-containing protein
MRDGQLESEDVLRTVVRSMAEGVVIWSAPSGDFMSCNEAAASVLEISPDALAKRGYQSPEWHILRENGEPFPAAELPVARAIATGQDQLGVVMGLQKPGGERVWLRSFAKLLRRSPEKAPYAVVNSFVDLTEARRARDLAETAAAYYARAMDGANVGTWELDLVSGKATRNSRWAAIFGCTPSEVPLTFAGLLERVHNEDVARVRTTIEAAMRTDQPYSIEYRGRHKDGRWIWVQSRGLVFDRGPDGAARRVAGVLVDIDERKRTEEELLRSLAENERLVHELRDTLNRVKTLEGLLPICMYCKNIRDDAGKWGRVETHLSRTGATLTHGLCPKCEAEHFPEKA